MSMWLLKMTSVEFIVMDAGWVPKGPKTFKSFNFHARSLCSVRVIRKISLDAPRINIGIVPQVLVIVLNMDSYTLS